MTNLISGAELHAAEASRPLLHHPPTTSQSISRLSTIRPIVETILILEEALEEVMFVWHRSFSSETKKQNCKAVYLTASSVILKFS